MAIIFNGKTKYPICGRVILDNEDIVMFPHFMPNIKDPLAIFSDSGAHTKCLRNHPLGKQAVLCLERVIFCTRPENRICKLGGNLIKSPDDYIFINMLTSDEKEELYQYNFITLDKNNLHKWYERENFIRTAIKFKADGNWQTLPPFDYWNI